MADAFQKFKNSFNRGITTISVKTSSTLEKSKLKTHIDSLQKEVDQYYAGIGESVYNMWLNGSSDLSSLTDSFNVVKKKREDIDGLLAEIAAIDERDKEILGGAAPVTPVAPAAPAAPADPNAHACTCPNCGAQFDTPINFCRQCGSKIG